MRGNEWRPSSRCGERRACYVHAGRVQRVSRRRHIGCFLSFFILTCGILNLSPTFRLVRRLKGSHVACWSRRCEVSILAPRQPTSQVMSVPFGYRIVQSSAIRSRLHSAERRGLRSDVFQRRRTPPTPRRSRRVFEKNVMTFLFCFRSICRKKLINEL